MGTRKRIVLDPEKVIECMVRRDPAIIDQQQLAYAAGLDVRSISSALNKHKITPYVASRIAKAILDSDDFSSLELADKEAKRTIFFSELELPADEDLQAGLARARFLVEKLRSRDEAQRRDRLFYLNEVVKPMQDAFEIVHDTYIDVFSNLFHSQETDSFSLDEVLSYLMGRDLETRRIRDHLQKMRLASGSIPEKYDCVVSYFFTIERYFDQVTTLPINSHIRKFLGDLQRLKSARSGTRMSDLAEFWVQHVDTNGASIIRHINEYYPKVYEKYLQCRYELGGVLPDELTKQVEELDQITGSLVYKGKYGSLEDFKDLQAKVRLAETKLFGDRASTRG